MSYAVHSRRLRLVAATLVLLVLILALAGCGPGRSSSADGGSPEEQRSDAGSLAPLSVGLMPAVDTAPFFLAQDAGYFTEEGLGVSFQVFTSGQDRQSALQTGRIDGAMTDLVAVAVNVAGGFDLRATMLTEGVFPILVRPDLDEEGASRVSIGLMEVSVTNFLADQWLSGEYELEKVFVNQVPARLEAVVSGQLDMGVFPEPIASLGVLRGLERRVFEPVDGFSPDVIAFTGAARANKGASIRAFQRAYNRAAADIREQPDRARDALLDNIPNLPEEIRDTMVLPVYHDARLPEDSAVDRIISWTEQAVADEFTIRPADLLDPSFLPGSPD